MVCSCHCRRFSAVFGIPLLAAIGSGFILSKPKRGVTPLSPIQVTQAPVTQPIETPTAAAAATSSAAELSAASADGVHDPQVVMPVDANPVEPAPARGHSAKSTVPSPFGALNAHPITTTHITPVTPPNLSSAVVPPSPENALLGITSPTSSMEVPEGVISGNAPVPVGGAVDEPRALKQVPPQYPDVALRTRTEGDVVVAVVIDKSGSVSSVKPVSGPPLLREAAVDAVRRWKYERTMLNGQPIAVQMLVTVRFHL